MRREALVKRYSGQGAQEGRAMAMEVIRCNENGIVLLVCFSRLAEGTCQYLDHYFLPLCLYAWKTSVCLCTGTTGCSPASHIHLDPPL